jgi:hypothetical protein
MFGFYSDSQAPFYGEQQINIFNCVSLSEFFLSDLINYFEQGKRFYLLFSSWCWLRRKKTRAPGYGSFTSKNIVIIVFCKNLTFHHFDVCIMLIEFDF